MDLRVYEALFRFDQGTEQALESLNIAGKPELGSPDGISIVRINLTELRSYANNCLASEIAQMEQEEENNFYRVRRNREKAEKGPNEIYLELKSHGEFRREHGLLPRAVIPSWTWAVDDRIVAMQKAAPCSLPIQPEEPRITGDHEQKNRKEVRRDETNCLRTACPARPQSSRIRQPFQAAC
jgi:hypothetical protein